MTEYTHEDAMRDLATVKRGAYLAEGLVGCSDRLTAYLDTLRAERDWLADHLARERSCGRAMEDVDDWSMVVKEAQEAVRLANLTPSREEAE